MSSLLLKGLLLFVPLLASNQLLPLRLPRTGACSGGGIDVDATLEIARIELDEGGVDAPLTLWAIRDQIVTANNARTRGPRRPRQRG